MLIAIVVVCSAIAYMIKIIMDVHDEYDNWPLLLLYNLVKWRVERLLQVMGSKGLEEFKKDLECRALYEYCAIIRDILIEKTWVINKK